MRTTGLLTVPTTVGTVCMNDNRLCQRDLRRSLAQSPAQNRVTSEVRRGYSGCYALGF